MGEDINSFIITSGPDVKHNHADNIEETLILPEFKAYLKSRAKLMPNNTQNYRQGLSEK